MSVQSGGMMDALERRELEERQTAVRALLRHPMLTAGRPDPNAFKLVRRHAPWLREWFAEVAGWSLRVDNGLARLQKRVPGSLTLLGQRWRAARARRSVAADTRSCALVWLSWSGLTHRSRWVRWLNG